MHHTNYTIGDIIYNPKSDRYFMLTTKYPNSDVYEMLLLHGDPLITGRDSTAIHAGSIDNFYRKVA